MAKKAAEKKVEEVEKNEATNAPSRREDVDVAVEKRLLALYALQKIDSQIDKIKIVRGELPLEVQDLEDEIIGLQTRIDKFSEEVKEIENNISEKKNSIVESERMIKKYETQQNNVRNNREYDSLSKEIEFQTLEIQLAERRIKEATIQLENKKEEIERAGTILAERKIDLEHKKADLEEITKETEKEEEELQKASLKQEEVIEDRYLAAYKRIRKNARNGLAVVVVERDACGGCFNKIPHQRQVEIRMHKKIIVCEHCGRILVDQSIADEVMGGEV